MPSSSLHQPTSSSRSGAANCALGLLLGLLFLAAPVLAQEEGPPPDQPALEHPAPEQPGPEEGSGDGAALPPPEQTTIYVPYQQLVDVFEKEGRGVFLPYEEFLQLWKSAGHQTPVTPPPPVPYVIGAVSYKGDAAERKASFTLSMEIETLASGWVEVPIHLVGIAVRSAQLGDSAAHITTTRSGLRLVVPEPGKHTLTLEIDAEVSSRPGEKQITFAGPRGAVTRLDLTIPEAGVLVEVDPAVAETLEATGSGGTRVLAFLASTEDDRVNIRWEPRRAEAAEVAGHRFGEVAASLRLEEGLVRYQAAIDYTLIQTEAREFVFSLPEDMTVLGIEGASLREWTSAPDAANPGRILYTASLYEPARNRHSLIVRAERSLDPGAVTLAAPDLRLSDVAREKGSLGVSAAPSIALAVSRRENLAQVDPADLPENTRGGATLAFRYLRHPYELELAVTRVEPRVTASVLSTVSLRADGVVSASVNVGLNIKKAGIFEVALDLPAEFDLREVGPDGLIDDYRIVDQDGARVLEISLARQTIGALNLSLVLETFRPDIIGDLNLPLVGVRDIERESGVVGVAGEASLKISTKESAGLTPIDVRELPGAGVGQVRATEPLLFGYRYHSRPVSGTLAVERKSPKVTAHLLSRISIAGNAVRYVTSIDYLIEFSGVSSFVVQVPQGFGEDVGFEGAAFKSAQRVAGEEGQPDIWTIETQAPRLGGWRLTASYDRSLPEVRAGQQTAFDVPILVLDGVERQTGHIAVLKEENLEVGAEASENLEAIDILDLPESREGAFLAFRYLEPAVTLSINVTRHEFEPVLAALVERMITHSVVDETGFGRHTTYLELKNTSEQFLHIRLSEGVKPQTIEVNGQEADIRSSGGVYLVQLPVGRTRGNGGGGITTAIIPVRIIATDETRERMGSRGNFDLVPPLFQSSDGTRSIPVVEQYYLLHLPAEHVYFDFGDDMDEWRSAGGVWEWLRHLAEALIPTIGGRRTDSSVHRWRAQLEQQVLASGQVSGDILARMRSFRFSRMREGGILLVSYSSQKRFYGSFLFLFLLAMGLGVLARRRAKMSRPRVVVILILVPMLLGPFASPTEATLMGAFSLAGVALAVIWLLLALQVASERGKAARTARRASKKDSPPGDAPPPAPPSGGPPADPTVPPAPPASAADADAGATEGDDAPVAKDKGKGGKGKGKSSKKEG